MSILEREGPTRPAYRRNVTDMTGPQQGSSQMPGMVDWDLAIATAQRLIRPGPQVSRSEADAVVQALRQLADVADGHVRELTGLQPIGPVPPTRVVDRIGWVRANASGMGNLMGPLMTRLAERRESQPGPRAAAVGARVTGAQAGVVLSFLAGKVLGQFELFGVSGGELLLVAPNVVDVERSLAIDPGDFRLWVCLHECTHRLQFSAVPWLGDHLSSRVEALVDALDLDPKVLRDRLAAAVRELAKAARGDDSGQGLLALIQGAQSKAIMDEITALMSLVEGHAEYVMDAVGTEVVPSVAAIRAKFDKRRKGSGLFDRLVRRLLGIDVKMRQYAEGGAFVRAVVDAIGMEAFNAVWTSPETLPRYSELARPMDWVERVHGYRPAAAS
jgi:coenzyme F420 biosynthesis associated uncharacterized protein